MRVRQHPRRPGVPLRRGACACAPRFGRLALNRASRAITRGLTVVLPLLLAPVGLSAQSATVGPVEVTELRFESAARFSDSELQGAILTTASQCTLPLLFHLVCAAGAGEERGYLDEAVLRADVLRLRLFYYQRGFRETEVEVEQTHVDGGAELVFHIDEGAPVRVESIEVVGAGGLFPGGSAGALPLLAGEPFNLLAYQAARDTLIERMKNLGYAHAEALAGYTIRAESPYQARVRYELLPGVQARFGPIEVVGADRVSPGIVRRMLAFERGDLYRPADLVDSQRNLFQLDIFRHAEIQPRFGQAPDSVIPVTVQVNEGDVYRVRLGAGLSTAECLNAEARWTSRNFAGGGRRLELRGRLSNVLAQALGGEVPCSDTGESAAYRRLTWLLSSDFTQPWFFGPRNTFRAGLFLERQSVPDVMIREALGGYASLVRSLGGQTSVSLGYRPELTRLDATGDLFFCVSFVACAFEEISDLRDPHWLAPVALSFARNRSNSLFAPTSGYVLQLDLEHASGATGSDFAYDRILADLAWYRGVARGVVLAARIRSGFAWSDDGLHPQKRFFAGGPNSVRGFAQYRLGPRVLTVSAADVLARARERGGAGCSETAIDSGRCSPTLVADSVAERAFEIRPLGGEALLEGSVELRFPLWGSFRGAAFLDVGQVWATSDAVELGDLKWTPGVGVRYLSPIGPIRVDVGHNPIRAEPLRVITTQVEYNDEGELVNTSALQPLQDVYPWDRFDSGSLWDRLQLHFSIGQAF